MTLIDLLLNLKCNMEHYELQRHICLDGPVKVWMYPTIHFE